MLHRLHRSDFKALRALAILVSLVYLPGLIGVCIGTFPFPEDALALYWPTRDWVRSEMLAGRMPLWDPNLFCGHPAAALNQCLLFYPPNLLLMPLPSAWAILLDSWAHNLFLAFGAYALARAWGLSRSSSCVAAALMGLSNAVAAHLFAGHNTWHDARAYIPWILLVTLLYLRGGSTRYLPWLAVLCWLQFSAGYPPISLLTGGACLYLTLARAVLRRRTRQIPALPRRWPLAVIAVPIATALLCSASLFPFREIAAQAVHGTNMSFGEATALSASVRTFVRLLLPDLFGGNDTNQWSIVLSPHEEAAYFGILALPLALLAPWLWRRRADAPAGLWVMLGALVFAAVLALGEHTPVYGWIWHASPFFRSLRVPARWMEVWALVAPLMAGAGFEWWLRRERPGRKWVTLASVMAATCMLLTVGIALSLSSPWWQTVPLWNRRLLMPHESHADQMKAVAELQQAALFAGLAGTLLCALGAALLARWNRATTEVEKRRAVRLTGCLLALDVLLVFLKSTHILAPDQIHTRLLWPTSLTKRWQPGQRWTTRVPIVVMNQGMRAGIPLYNGYDPLSSGRYWDFASSVDGEGDWRGPYEPSHLTNLLRVAGVTHVLQLTLDGPVKLSKTRDDITLEKEASEGKWTLWRLRYSLDAPIWPNALQTDLMLGLPQSKQLDALRNVSAAKWHGQIPVVTEAGRFGGFLTQPFAAPVPIFQSATLKAWRLEPRESLFVNSEALAPGWKAYVDGKPASLEYANYLFRAVPIPKGSRKVTLVFDSWTQRTGLFLTLCGLLGLGFWAGSTLGRKKPSTAPPQE